MVSPDVSSLRRALRSVAPQYAQGSIDIRPSMAVRPQWRRAVATVDRRWIVKFCWSDEAAGPLIRQGRLLDALSGYDPRLPTPSPVLVSEDPALLIYPRIPGRTLTYEAAGQLSVEARRSLAASIGNALAALHSPASLSLVRDAAIELASPQPQASSGELRTRLVPLLDEPIRRRVTACLHWVDDVLDESPAPVSLLHGDWHGHNLLTSRDRRVLRGVLDLEEAAIGDYHYDFRYLPRQAPTLDLLHSVVERYSTVTGRVVSLARVMAWHVLTDLGDALWRTKARVEVVAGPAARRAADLLVLLDQTRTELTTN